MSQESPVDQNKLDSGQSLVQVSLARPSSIVMMTASEGGRIYVTDTTCTKWEVRDVPILTVKTA